MIYSVHFYVVSWWLTTRAGKIIIRFVRKLQKTNALKFQKQNLLGFCSFDLFLLYLPALAWLSSRLCEHMDMAIIIWEIWGELMLINATKLVWLASVFHFMSGLLSGAIAGLQGLGTHNDLVWTSLRWETWKRKQTGETERTTKHTDTRLPTKETMMARHRHETRNNKKTETRNNLRCTRENLNNTELTLSFNS